ADPVTARHVPSGQAQVAGPARDEDLHRHPVAGLDAPARRGHRADLLDDPERLVPGHHRQPLAAQVPAVLFHLAAPHPAPLHAPRRPARARGAEPPAAPAAAARSAPPRESCQPSASSVASRGISGTGPAAVPASGVYAQYLARAPPSTTKSHPVIRRA